VARHVAVLFLLALGLAGCDHAAEAKPLPRSVWIARANAICARGDREIHALGGATALPALARVLERTARISDRQLTELKALRSDPSQHAAVETILDGMQRVNTALGDLVFAARSGDQSRVDRAAGRLLALERKDDRLVAGYGLHECLSNDG
jgi:hypothetical protein